MEKGFTEDGTGIWLNDVRWRRFLDLVALSVSLTWMVSLMQGDGNPLDEPTPVDAVVYATGYRQQAGFVDPKVVDMRWERDGNDVPLFKGWCVVHSIGPHPLPVSLTPKWLPSACPFRSTRGLVSSTSSRDSRFHAASSSRDTC